VFYVHFNALLGYIGTATSKGDERKDDSPFRHALAGCEPTLASGLRFCDQRQKYCKTAYLN